MTKAKEITLRAAFVSDELTAAASSLILSVFGGYFKTEGQGGYTFSEFDATEEVPAIEWKIGTSKKDSELLDFVILFATEYCKAGAEESVYFIDTEGFVYLAFPHEVALLAA
jgi:hypothetical protein